MEKKTRGREGGRKEGKGRERKFQSGMRTEENPKRKENGRGEKRNPHNKETVAAEVWWLVRMR